MGDPLPQHRRQVLPALTTIGELRERADRLSDRADDSLGQQLIALQKQGEQLKETLTQIENGEGETATTPRGPYDADCVDCRSMARVTERSAPDDSGDSPKNFSAPVAGLWPVGCIRSTTVNRCSVKNTGSRSHSANSLRSNRTTISICPSAVPPDPAGCS
jgi:hypothetical protein